MNASAQPSASLRRVALSHPERQLGQALVGEFQAQSCTIVPFDAEADCYVIDARAPFAGAFAPTQLALGRALSHASTRQVVVLASPLVDHAQAHEAALAAEQGAIVAYARTLAREVGKRGITLNVVSLGMLEDEALASLDEAARQKQLARIPAQRFGTLQEACAAIAFAARPGFMTGAVLNVDGGLS